MRPTRGLTVAALGLSLGLGAAACGEAQPGPTDPAAVILPIAATTTSTVVQTTTVAPPTTVAPATTVATTPATTRATTPATTTRATATTAPSVYYANCTAARAAGAAPVRRGQPGYGSHLDRDNDGIGCE